MATLTVFHTNDLHNCLSQSKADRLRALREQTPDSVLLDAGDAIWAGNIYVRPGGEPVLRLMSDAGYDAMAMGNREFHFLQSGLRAKLGWARFPVLCANIRPTKRGARAPVVPWISTAVGEVRVAVLGLTVPLITERMLSRRVSAYVFDDPIKTAAALVPDLRAEHDIIIALTHIGLKEDRRLADTVPGVDLIVGGHSHTVLEIPDAVGGVPIVQAGWRGRHIGCVRIDTAGNGVKVTSSIMEL